MSGTRTGRELAASLAKVKEEALSLAAYLGKEVPTHLSIDQAGMGAGKVDGSTRALLVKEAEKLRSAALDKALEELPDQSVRAKMVRKNLDKFSTALFLASFWPYSGIPPTCLFTRLESSLVPAGFLTAQFLQKT